MACHHNCDWTFLCYATEQETFTLCWIHVRPPSSMMGQHWADVSLFTGKVDCLRELNDAGRFLLLYDASEMALSAKIFYGVCQSEIVKLD